MRLQLAALFVMFLTSYSASATTYILSTTQLRFEIIRQPDVGPPFAPVPPVTSVPQEIVHASFKFKLHRDGQAKDDIPVDRVDVQIAGYNFRQDHVFVDYLADPGGEYELLYIGAVIDDQNWRFLDDNRNIQILSNYNKNPPELYTDNDFNLQCIIFTGYGPQCRMSYDRAGYVAHFMADRYFPASFTAIPEPASWISLLFGLGFIGIILRGRTANAQFGVRLG